MIMHWLRKLLNSDFALAVLELDILLGTVKDGDGEEIFLEEEVEGETEDGDLEEEDTEEDNTNANANGAINAINARANTIT